MICFSLPYVVNFVYLFITSQLSYIDSLDVTGLDLTLPDGRFAVNVWSKENIDAALLADKKPDGTYGKLEVFLISSFLCVVTYMFTDG